MSKLRCDLLCANCLGVSHLEVCGEAALQFIFLFIYGDCICFAFSLAFLYPPPIVVLILIIFKTVYTDWCSKFVHFLVQCGSARQGLTCQ